MLRTASTVLRGARGAPMRLSSELGPVRSLVSTRVLLNDDKPVPSEPTPTKQKKVSMKSAYAKVVMEQLDVSKLAKEKQRDMRGIDEEQECLLDSVLDDCSLTEDVRKDIFQLSSFGNASKTDILKRRIKNTMEKYQRFPGDTGSTEVQVAVASVRIMWLRELQTEFKKDMLAKKALSEYFHHRRRLMKYLKRERFDKYNLMLVDFNITEEEIWEWGRLPGRPPKLTRYPGALNESRFDRAKREAWEKEAADKLEQSASA